MSYVIPSVLVYQQLANAGGVANSTPDLEACIIGPLNNIVTYVPGSVASLIQTAAISSTTTTATATAGSYQLTGVANPGPFTVGTVIVVQKAGASGANMQATITVVTGDVFTLDTAVSTSVESATISPLAAIANPTISNTFNLNSTWPGQLVTSSSVQVYLNNVLAETVTTKAYGYPYNNLLTFTSGSVMTTAVVTSGATTATLVASSNPNYTMFSNGDTITMAGAGVAGGLYTGTITSGGGTANITFSPATSTTTGAAVAVTKVAWANVNSTTNTLRLESGDKIEVSYTNPQSVAKTFSTTANVVTTTSLANGDLQTVSLADMLPVDTSKAATTTTGTNASGATLINVASTTGFSTGSQVIVYGGGVAGANLTTTATVSSGTTLTLGVALSTTLTAGAVIVQNLITSGTNNVGVTNLVVVSSSGFVVGDHIVVAGGGAGGADLVSTVSVVPDGTHVTMTDGLVTQVTAGTVVTRAPNLSISVQKTYNNQLLATTKPISGGSQIDLTNVTTTGAVTISANPEIVYGKIKFANVYMGYTALRTDQSNTVLAINDILDAEGQLGDLTDANPLGLGVTMALSNTTGRVRAISLSTNDLNGYLAALNLAESERLYYLVPLTQDSATIAAFQAHVDQMSTPELAEWRVAIVNTAIPTMKDIGSFSSSNLNSNSGNNTITNISSFWTLTSSNSTFISDGLTAGDYINVWVSGTTFNSYQINTVVSNQQVTFVSGAVSAPQSAVSFYASRTLTKTQQASVVAATSAQFNDKRIWHVQPDYCGISINGTVKKLPGYYLCCGLAGMGAGFPVQQGFTNIGVAGISTLYDSNYYFSKTDLNTMAGSGTLLFVQTSQNGIPYVRHELTTDMSVLEYREVLVVKNWDFLSYYYYDKLKMFIGSWNITPDTINIIRQTIVSASELLITKKLPKIGPPLLGYTINSIAQDTNNKDNLNVNLQIQVVYPLNYLNLYLII